MSRTSEITNSADVIDSRDVIERIKYLDGTEDEDERAELALLKSLEEEAECYCPDWRYGATLIRDSYLKKYTQETASDCGLIKDDAAWPNNCIDWDEATEQFKQDYTSVDFDGVIYWVR